MDLPLPSELRREERLWTLAYWLCQILAWGLYSVIGLLMARRAAAVDGSVFVGYGLFWVYSIALTHAFRRHIERHKWLSLPLRSAFLRLAAGSLVTSTIQTLLIAIISGLLRGFDHVFADSTIPQPALAFILWLNIGIVTAVWTALFAGIASMLRTRWIRERNEILESSFNRAKLKNLEAQLSPHFFFNSLNSIRGLVTENPALARDMITRLANILRYGLQSSEVSTHALSDELAVVEDYLALEKMRFEERLLISRDLDARTLALPVPATLVQTLVENAIKHGIALLAEGGTVGIRSAIVDGMHEISVTNPGRLLPSPQGSTRVGLINLRERLLILHGPRASVELSESPDKLVCARVRLPLPPMAESFTSNA